jgi:uncharacterized protein YndB with AHSA1/START domain
MSNQPAPLPASTPEAEGVIGKDEQDRVTVTFTRTYPHPVEQVWRAITDPEQSRHWLGKLAFDPQPGGKFEMILDGSDPIHGTVTHGEVIACDPPHLLEYWFHAQDGDVVRTDRHINRWELRTVDSSCQLRFINTFAPGERARNSILCGWHAMVEMLDETIGGHQRNWSTYTRDRMTELYWHYRNKPR